TDGGFPGGERGVNALHGLLVRDDERRGERGGALRDDDLAARAGVRRVVARRVEGHLERVNRGCVRGGPLGAAGKNRGDDEVSGGEMPGGISAEPGDDGARSAGASAVRAEAPRLEKEQRGGGAGLLSDERERAI